MEDRNDSHMRGALPLIVGFAALLCLITLQSLVGRHLPSSSLGYLPLIAQRCLEAATFLTVALLSSWLKGLASHRGLMWACTGGLVAEAAIEGLVVLVGVTGLAPLAHLVYCLVGGIVPSLLWMAWIELYARLDLRRMTALFLTANVLQALLSLATSLNAPLALALAAMGVLPIVSAALLERSRVDLEASGAGGAADAIASAAQEAQGTAQSTRFPLAPVLLMATFTLANVFARDVLPSADRSWATLGVLVCLAMLAVALHRSPMRYNLWPLVAVAFPLTLAGLFGLLLDAGTWGIPATLLTHAGDTLFGVFIAAVLCNVAFRYGTSALYLFGLAKAAGSLAALAGAMLAFTAGPWEGDSLVLLVAAMALALTACYIVLSWREPGEITWGAGEADRPDTPAKPEALRPSDIASLRQACSGLAYDYGLTRREEEVLILLAQGMTAQQIETSLCVSNSTVKSHTHAVYQKLGVHSRGELAERVSGMQGGVRG